MFAEFLKRNEFYQKYMQLLATRMAIGNVEMENPDIQGSLSDKYLEIYSNMEAFKMLIENDQEKITPYDIVDLVKVLSNGGYDCFRKTQVEVRKAKNFFPIEAKDVLPKMYAIMDSYYKIWDALPVYEREAKLHIELVRTQPFEDCNKRTARILTNYNLCKQNRAPIIINGKETEEYFSYIDNYDIDGLAKFFETKSKIELQVMMNFYTSICGDGMIPETPEEDNSLVKIYQKQYTDK